MRLHALHLVLAASVALATATRAHADPEVALDRFEPVPAGDALLSTPDVDARGARRLSLAAVLSYAHEPLVLAMDSQRTVLVDHQLVGHLQASLALSHAFVVDAALPSVLSQGGDTGRAGTFELGGPSGSDVGDLRLSSRLALLAPRDHIPGAAFTTTVWFPTATGRYAGSPTTRAGAGAVFGSDYDRFFWRLHVGARHREADAVYAGVFGSEALGSFGLGYRLGRAQLGAELIGATGMDAGAGWFGRNTTHLEALASAKIALSPVSAFVGAGPGIGRGAGTPAFRVIVGLGASFELAQAERRGAARGSGAATGASTQPPAVSPPPEPDRDRDGVSDARDQCPDRAGDPDAPRPGCPRDLDSDGVADAVDACPTLPGVASADPKLHGCPPDRDGDGISDATDACPDEKGEAKTQGCPVAVRVVGQQIVITDQVNFATGRDVLAPESSAVLEQVAAVLEQHPEIARVAVDGHTDNVGQEKANLALSRRRAIAVVRWLVARGVDERRLEARGFGPRRPIADTKTAEGRAKNRRVEFQILKKTELGPRGWKDGAVDE